MLASTLLRAARCSAGQSQRELARRAGKAQPQIADVERGRHDVSVTALNHLLVSTGYRLLAVPTTRTTAAETAEATRSALRFGRPEHALREALQLSDDLRAASIGLRVLLTAVPPAPTGDPRYDALLAGIVELRLPEELRPAWVGEPHRVLLQRWWVDDTPGSRELNLTETPPALLRHGVVLAAVELESV